MRKRSRAFLRFWGTERDNGMHVKKGKRGAHACIKSVKNAVKTKFVVCTIDFAAGYGTLKLRCYAREKGKHPGGLR